jgi:hypothetical protein
MGSGSRSSVWKILIGLSIVCGLLVFAGGFFHRRALEQSVQDAQDASTLYVRTKLSRDVHGLDLSKPLKDAQSSSLAKSIDAPGDAGVRIFAPNGTPVFTEGVDAFPADVEALTTAKTGDVGRVIDGPDLRVYTPIAGKGERVDAVAVVVSNYTAMRKAAEAPLDDYRLPLVGVGVALLIAGIALMLQATKGAGVAPVKVPATTADALPRSSKARVTGFNAPAAAAPPEPTAQAAAAQLQAAVTHASASVMGATVEGEASAPKKRFSLGKKAPEPASEPEAQPAKEKRSLFGRHAVPAATDAATAAPADASALQREIAIREALEDQLEQLRTQVKSQQDERTTVTRELSAQLEEAIRRAEQAEGQLQAVGAATAPATDDRVAALEQEVAQAKAAAADAIARAEQLQRVAAATPPPAPTPDPAAEQRLAELGAQLTDAQQRASSAEQRAASVESVRDELEVRVAQLGTKATELEQRAAELESNLQDANAGGDAVRAEIATLTAALAGANARVQELESLSSAPSTSDNEAETMRLRAELAKQLERAQAAEDRIASLEADVLAAQRGVRSLPTERPPMPVAEPRREEVPQAPAADDRYTDVWAAQSAPAERPRPAEPAPREEPAEAPAASAAPRDGNGYGEAEPEQVASSEPAEVHEGDDEASPEDMWSLRARLAEAAARKKHHLE